jgi:hypothetical protein
MKPYGINRYRAGDLDAAGCAGNGRATRVYNPNGRAYHSLRRGKKAATRRILKRFARLDGKLACYPE